MKTIERYPIIPATVATCACMCINRISRSINPDRYDDFRQVQRSIRGFHHLNYEDRETLILVCSQLLDLLPNGCRPRIEIRKHHKDILSTPELSRNGFVISFITRSDLMLSQKQQQLIANLGDAFVQHGLFFSLSELLELLNVTCDL